jgi:Na+/H+ antiporter NhaD/arsenite permease-like protein
LSTSRETQVGLWERYHRPPDGAGLALDSAAVKVALTIFLISYLVIAFQRIPALHLGRPAGALLGAVAMVAFGVLDFDAALTAIDMDKILFLLGMMVILAYLELSGFFEATERAILRRATSARGLLW